VRLQFLEHALELDVEDRGSGFHPNGRRGIGLVAMRERAEILGGTLDFLQPQGGGTLVRLSVPKEVAEVGV
jgi:signal transduction histidine kinase